MLPYFIMVGVPTFLSICLSQIKIEKSKADRIVTDVFFAIWFLLLLLRSIHVGSDMLNYKLQFRVYSSFSWERLFRGILDGELEAGYVLISKAVHLFTRSFRVMLAVCTVISVAPIWWLYRKEGKMGALLIVMFLNVAPFTMYFSGLRQAMAMAFVLPCFKYCKENSFWKFLFVVFVAYLFHGSALILLLLYPIYHVDLRKQFYILFFIPVFFVIFVNNEAIFRFLILFTGKYADEYVDGIKQTGAISVTLLLLALLIYCFIIPDVKKLDKEFVGLRNVLMLSSILQIFSGVHTIAMRFNYYFLLLVPLLIVKSISVSDKKYHQITQLSLICMYVFFAVFYFYHAYTSPDILNVYPYQFLFSDYR